MTTDFVYGLTFAAMRDPSRIKKDARKQALEKKRTDPVDPVNLFNVSGRSTRSADLEVLPGFRNH